MLKRQPHPYTSNCTNTWTSTDYTDVIRDTEGKYTRRKGNYINYNLAVRGELSHYLILIIFKAKSGCLIKKLNLMDKIFSASKITMYSCFAFSRLAMPEDMSIYGSRNGL